MPRLSIIILCHRGDRWIAPCMRSLEHQSLDRSAYEILLVDNGGTTPAIHHRRHAPNVRLLHFKNNLGFAEGNNRALAHARSDLIILLNQDIVVHHRFLEEMLRAFEARPSAGVVAANMQMASLADGLDLDAPPVGPTGLYRLTPMGYATYESLPTDHDLTPIRFASGNGLGFRRALLDSVGAYLFDARLGSYAEDLDLALRIAGTPWEMVLCAKAVIYHFRDEAFAGHPLALLSKYVHVSSNRWLVYFNNLPFERFLAKFPLLLVGAPLKVARADGVGKAHLSRLMIGTAALPLVLLWFLAKMIGSRQHSRRLTR